VLKLFLIVFVIICAGLAGFLSIGEKESESYESFKDKPKRLVSKRQSQILSFPRSLPKSSIELDQNLIEKPKEKFLRGERLLYFRTDEEYESFLKKAHAEGLLIVDHLSKLRLVKIRFPKKTKESDFLARFEDVDFVSENDAVETPQPLIQTASVGFRSDPLDFLGIQSTSGWGQGVTVAVIDSGVVEHRSLPHNIKHFDLIGGAAELESYHGTAVASLIVGDSNHIKGVAPSTQILDIRALRNDGGGDAFTVSRAIVLAVENGARIINMSLGTASDSPALREAVLYAQNAGALIVAAVGNEGVGNVSFPAAYPGVVGVGAVDAHENYQYFSNRGPEVDVTAPGVEVKAAGLNEAIVYFSGTSAAAPLVSAALAYELSQNPTLGNEELVEILKSNSNDAGPPGGDNFYGEGILNVGRIEASTGEVFTDVAASGFYLEPIQESGDFKLTFSGENRGNSLAEEMVLQLSYPGFEKSYIYHDVESSETVYDFLTVPYDSRLLNGDFEIVLKVISKEKDVNTANNVKSARIKLQKSSEKSE
jgi:hypothetical protein